MPHLATPRHSTPRRASPHVSARPGQSGRQSVRRKPAIKKLACKQAPRTRKIIFSPSFLFSRGRLFLQGEGGRKPDACFVSWESEFAPLVFLPPSTRLHLPWVNFNIPLSSSPFSGNEIPHWRSSEIVWHSTHGSLVAALSLAARVLPPPGRLGWLSRERLFAARL